MAERILIPLDGSRSSETALNRVKQLINEIKPGVTTEVILLEVVKRPVKHIPVEGGVVDIYGDEEELQLKKTSALEYLKKTARKISQA